MYLFDVSTFMPTEVSLFMRLILCIIIRVYVFNFYKSSLFLLVVSLCFSYMKCFACRVFEGLY